MRRVTNYKKLAMVGEIRGEREGRPYLTGSGVKQRKKR